MPLLGDMAGAPSGANLSPGIGDGGGVHGGPAQRAGERLLDAAYVLMGAAPGDGGAEHERTDRRRAFEITGDDADELALGHPPIRDAAVIPPRLVGRASAPRLAGERVGHDQAKAPSETSASASAPYAIAARSATAPRSTPISVCSARATTRPSRRRGRVTQALSWKRQPAFL